MTIFPFIFLCLLAIAYGHGDYPHMPPMYDHKPAPYGYKPPYMPYGYKPEKPEKPQKQQTIIPLPIPIPLPLPSKAKPLKMAIQVSNIQESGVPVNRPHKNRKGHKKNGFVLTKLPIPYDTEKKEFIGNLLEVPKTGIGKPSLAVPSIPIAKPVTNPPVLFPGSAASDLASFASFIKPLLNGL